MTFDLPELHAAMILDLLQRTPLPIGTWGPIIGPFLMQFNEQKRQELTLTEQHAATVKAKAASDGHTKD